MKYPLYVIIRLCLRNTAWISILPIRHTEITYTHFFYNFNTHTHIHTYGLYNIRIHIFAHDFNVMICNGFQYTNIECIRHKWKHTNTAKVYFCRANSDEYESNLRCKEWNGEYGQPQRTDIIWDVRNGTEIMVNHEVQTKRTQCRNEPLVCIMINEYLLCAAAYAFLMCTYSLLSYIHTGRAWHNC